MRINGDALDGTLVRLELVPYRQGPHVDQTHVTLLAGRYQHLVLGREHQTARALVVARERHHQRLAVRQYRVPDAHVLALGTVAGGGQQAARAEEHEVADALVVALQRLEQRGLITIVKYDTHDGDVLQRTVGSRWR